MPLGRPHSSRQISAHFQIYDFLIAIFWFIYYASKLPSVHSPRTFYSGNSESWLYSTQGFGASLCLWGLRLVRCMWRRLLPRDFLSVKKKFDCNNVMICCNFYMYFLSLESTKSRNRNPRIQIQKSKQKKWRLNLYFGYYMADRVPWNNVPQKQLHRVFLERTFQRVHKPLNL